MGEPRARSTASSSYSHSFYQADHPPALSLVLCLHPEMSDACFAAMARVGGQSAQRDHWSVETPFMTIR